MLRHHNPLLINNSDCKILTHLIKNLIILMLFKIHFLTSNKIWIRCHKLKIHLKSRVKMKLKNKFIFWRSENMDYLHQKIFHKKMSLNKKVTLMWVLYNKYSPLKRFRYWLVNQMSNKQDKTEFCLIYSNSNK